MTLRVKKAVPEAGNQRLLKENRHTYPDQIGKLDESEEERWQRSAEQLIRVRTG
jgi:hypothetical protein